MLAFLSLMTTSPMLASVILIALAIAGLFLVGLLDASMRNPHIVER